MAGADRVAAPMRPRCQRRHDVRGAGRGRGKAKPGGSTRDLFARELRRDTLGLCGAFFFCLLAIYVGSAGSWRC